MAIGEINKGISGLFMMFMLVLFFIPMFIYWLLSLKKFNKIGIKNYTLSDISDRPESKSVSDTG
jgi:hypothetical protein